MKRFWGCCTVIKVVNPGLLTTVQDEGRFGMYAIGMPPSGAMDVFSYRVANYLVGNEPGAAVLETTYLGPQLEFTEDAVIAITGADAPPKINGKGVGTWEILQVKAGDVLSFDYLRSGARSYLAIAGGIDVPLVLGSRSTYPLTGIGGFQGRKLQAGGVLPVGVAVSNAAKRVGMRLPDKHIPTFSNETEVRVVVGLCSYRLTQESKEGFLNTTWIVTPDADRIGYRYKGGRLEFVPREPPFGAGSDPSNVVDLGYPVGSIQVPGGVEPIVLLNDAVTGGGYATIGTVISVDRDRVAQSKTNDKTRFRSVTLEEALQARKVRQQQLAEIASVLAS
jgi:biotin-dependent carboxylase-like uncharacterized protein